MSAIKQNLNARVTKAVAHYWQTRDQQGIRQGLKNGQRDYGARASVTGGAQMNGFILLLCDLIRDAGVAAEHIYHKQSLPPPRTKE